jgi:membrane-bound lytic murein transglycosylase F
MSHILFHENSNLITYAIVSENGGEGGVRTHVGFPPNRFRVGAVMTASVPLRELVTYTGLSTSILHEGIQHTQRFARFFIMFKSLHHPIAGTAGLLLSLLALPACVSQPPALERVHARGELVVLTRNSPTTYYEGPNGPTGLEYDLAKRFADYLGVKLKIVPVKDFDSILPMIRRGAADLAAAGLTVTPARKQLVRFGPSYQEIVPQLICRADSTPPRSFADLGDSRLEVIAGSSHVERLMNFKVFFPELHWHETSQYTSEELLDRVSDNEIDYTIADSNELALAMRFNPDLQSAFALGTPQQLAWAFPQGGDRSLLNAAVEFFAELRRTHVIDALMERYYGHMDAFSSVGTRTYLAHIRKRLPPLRRMFEEAGKETGLDWRLLAAIGYQESKWDVDARSPTGVRGVMMLTEDTAASLGVKDRTDPRDSILGGARYFKQVKDALPEHIKDPVRTWMALAGYNIGLGHLEDARRLTEKNGGNPDDWTDVKKSLGLLSKHQWFTQTKLGYARGFEALQLVENVRSYYDILSWPRRIPGTLASEKVLEPREEVAPPDAIPDAIPELSVPLSVL